MENPRTHSTFCHARFLRLAPTAVAMVVKVLTFLHKIDVCRIRLGIATHFTLSLFKFYFRTWVSNTFKHTAFEDISPSCMLDQLNLKI